MNRKNTVRFSSEVTVYVVDADTASKVQQACDLMRLREQEHRDASACVIQYFWWKFKKQKTRF